MKSYPFRILDGAAEAHSRSGVASALGLRPFIARRVDRLKEAESYEPKPALMAAIHVAIATGRPLLLTGEPGTGKTMAAYYVASRLCLGEPVRFQVRSDSRARDLLYSYDAVARYQHTGSIAAIAEGTGPERDMPFVKPGPMWQAFRGGAQGPRLLLVDEIDKAPRDFPNDLLREFEEFRFDVEDVPPPYNTVICPAERIPITVITSNSERRLPEPFLRRCIYHNIEMDDELIELIVRRRLGNLGEPGLRAPFLDEALRVLRYIRANRSLDKRPTVDEFWLWLETLSGDGQADERAKVSAAAQQLDRNERADLASLPYIGCLVKTAEDRQRLSP